MPQAWQPVGQGGEVGGVGAEGADRSARSADAGDVVVGVDVDGGGVGVDDLVSLARSGARNSGHPFCC